MRPSEGSKNRYVPGYLLGDIGDGKIIEHNNLPVLIIKKSNNDYVVWDLMPKFSGEMVASCSIIQVQKSWNRDASFVEPCSSSWYGAEGEVLDISHPLAMPMKKIEWSVKGNYLVISKNT